MQLAGVLHRCAVCFRCFGHQLGTIEGTFLGMVRPVLIDFDGMVGL